MKTIVFICFMLLSMTMYARNQNTDIYDTKQGQLTVTLLGHGSLMLQFNGKVIYVDPYSKAANYDTLPKADLIVLTHEHGDHLDAAAIGKVKTDETKFVMNTTCYQQLKTGEELKNGRKTSFNGIGIEAVAAYNMVHKRPDGKFYHPKGEGNGYIFTFGDKRLYVAGDTENTPEMKALKNIDIAFLPMNLPYTMAPEMVADAAQAFKPAYLYPYHYGAKEDLDKLKDLLNNSGITIVIKNNGQDIVQK